MTAEDIEKIKKLYRRGASIKKIAQEMHTYDKKIRLIVAPLVAAGELEPRECKPNPRAERAAERMVTVIKLYKEGQSYKEIAAATDTTYENIVYMVRKAIDEGQCERIPRKKPATHGTNGGVICNESIKRRCKYGYDGVGISMCNYLFITGKMRECSGKDCTCYEERTEKMPSRRRRNNDDVFC